MQRQEQLLHLDAQLPTAQDIQWDVSEEEVGERAVRDGGAALGQQRQLS